MQGYTILIVDSTPLLSQFFILAFKLVKSHVNRQEVWNGQDSLCFVFVKVSLVSSTFPSLVTFLATFWILFMFCSLTFASFSYHILAFG